MKVLGIGNALVDVLAILDSDSYIQKAGLTRGGMELIDEERLVKINEILATLNPSLACGGSSANTIVGLAKMGVETGFIGKVGEDSNGAFYREGLTGSGVKPLLLTGDLPSGCANGFISPGGERTFGTYLGSAATLHASDLSLSLFEGYDVLHIEGYLMQDYDLIRAAVLLAKEAGLKVSLDMASFNVVKEHHAFFTELIEKYADIVFANEEEAHAFTDKEPEESALILSQLCEIAIVKCGKDGSIIRRGEEVARVGSIDAKCIDTTGAGDLYAAGFIYALSQNYSLEKAGMIGAIVAGNVVEVVGPRMDNERWDEIKLKVAQL